MNFYLNNSHILYGCIDLSVILLDQAENRATEAERAVTKLQKEVDRLEGMSEIRINIHDYIAITQLE